MNPGTRTRLELLLDHYSRARRRTLHMLLGISKEDLAWHASPGLPSAGELVQSLAEREEKQIHGRVRGLALAELKRVTSRLVRRVMDGVERPKSASLLRDLEDLTDREMAVAGQIDLLCRLRMAGAARIARPIPPGRAGHAVPERKSLARKASV